MFHVFTADSADDLWQQAADRFRTLGGTTSQASRAGPTKELLHAALELRSPRERWISSRSPAINIAFALAEVVWIIRGRTDSGFLNYFNSRLPEFAGVGTTYHGAYGHRLKHVAGFDQLDAAFKALKAMPDSRQVVLQIWNGETDFPRNNGKPVAPDIPCNVIAMLKVRDGVLEWTQIMRSNDLFRGFVHNVIQFTFLHEIMAGWLGLKPGSYHHFSDSLHVYDDDVLEMDGSALGNAPGNSDIFDFSKEDSDTYFAMIEQLVEVIISTESSARDLLDSLGDMDAPGPFLNIGRILVCEGLRRRGEIDAMNRVLSECSNPAYSFLYNRWLLRMNCPPTE